MEPRVQHCMHRADEAVAIEGCKKAKSATARTYSLVWYPKADSCSRSRLGTLSHSVSAMKKQSFPINVSLTLEGNGPHNSMHSSNHLAVLCWGVCSVPIILHFVSPNGLRLRTPRSLPSLYASRVAFQPSPLMHDTPISSLRKPSNV